MKWIGLNELREKFLKFFESKEHLLLPSFPVIPKDDNSLLLINSGMAPMKKYFTGEIKPPKNRIATCQKCIRTPDIESVGITARHGTYFEMLGCFSFGDYFKHEITKWAWEFCVDVLEMPKDRLWISIYEDDDETFDIWTKEVCVDPSHIVRLGKADNFWEHGKGPCGPCSELYFDRGKEYSCGAENCGVGCDCDRYIEFWNLVFTQFENDGNNNYSKLSSPNIDTGMGLERLACIMQGVDNIFLIDTIQSIIKKICKIANVNYGENPKTDISIRIIADHIRSTTFMISDGVMPSNEGRGYVLKRLLRRAARQGKLLGINKPFLTEILTTVIEENKNAYPALEEKSEFIKKVVKVEEENFLKTIDQGLLLLEQLIEKSNSNIISGDDAFKLNDTYGFPIDLTKEILEEKNMKVDESRFKELLKEQKERARNARQNAGEDAWAQNSAEALNIEKTEFCGYEKTSSISKVKAILKDGKNIERAFMGDEVAIILDKTPFYARGGGQVGDVGTISNDSLSVSVVDTYKNSEEVYFHKAKIISGEISLNDTVKAEIATEFRNSVARNHTAAHLLQAALREILGNHVEQAGQLVNEKEVRFDFTHFSALNEDEISLVENLVNKKILEAISLNIKEMALSEAKESGAMALFNEKYKDIVRVVEVKGFSKELCGGTHVENTAQIGLFKITSESSIASGVRRITAVTGLNVLNVLNDYYSKIEKLLKTLKVSHIDALEASCCQLISESKEKDKTIEELTSKIANFEITELLNSSKEVNDTKVMIKKFSNASMEFLKTLCDKLKDKCDDFVSIFFNIAAEKATIVVALGEKTINKNLHAGKIVKEIAQLAGGNGGGKPSFATAGIKETSKIDYVIEKAFEIVFENL